MRTEVGDSIIVHHLTLRPIGGVVVHGLDNKCICKQPFEDEAGISFLPHFLSFFLFFGCCRLILPW